MIWKILCSTILIGLGIASAYRNAKVTRIYRAARTGDIAALVRMRERGVDLFQSRTGYNVLHEAARSGSPESLRFLLKHVPPGLIDRKDPIQGSPLHHAVALGRTDAVQILLDAGADPNLQDNSPWHFTPLRLAMANNHYEIVSILNNHGALL